jgi:hypothetical protein
VRWAFQALEKHANLDVQDNLSIPPAGPPTCPTTNLVINKC